MAQEKITQTAGHVQLGEFAPKFAELNDDVLFGQVWNRPGLSPHDRSMITIATLVGKGIIDSSLTHHLQFARQNGVTRTEISEMLTHIAFYAGWPNAWGAFRLAKDVWAEDTEADGGKAAFQREMIFPIGEPNTAYAEYFIGNSYLAPISTEQVSFSNVTFEPGCRNNWHIHRASKGGGQMLVCVAGRGWYQEEGKPAVEMLPGDVIPDIISCRTLRRCPLCRMRGGTAECRKYRQYSEQNGRAIESYSGVGQSIPQERQGDSQQDHLPQPLRRNTRR